MKIIIAGVLLLCIGIACAERRFPQRSLAARAASADGNQPYWFLGAPRKVANSIQSVQVPLSGGDLADDDDDEQEINNYEQPEAVSIVQDDDDDDDSSFDDHTNEESFENDDENEESELSGNVIGIISLNEGNTILSNRKDKDVIFELENREREINDDDDDDDDNEESGETAIFLPRAALEKLPDGSILALVDDSDSTGRAVRKYYRRRRRGNSNRRRRGNNQRRRRRRGGNRRRRRPTTIRVIRPGRRGNGATNRRRRPNVIRL